jgi:putative addiction module component (TIGR02574 family)
MSSDPLVQLEVVAEQALQLEAEERAELAERLWLSVQGAQGLHPAWEAEIASRVADMDAGNTDFVSADDAMTELRAHILGQRPA